MDFIFGVFWVVFNTLIDLIEWVINKVDWLSDLTKKEL